MNSRFEQLKKSIRSTWDEMKVTNKLDEDYFWSRISEASGITPQDVSLNDVIIQTSLDCKLTHYRYQSCEERSERTSN